MNNIINPINKNSYNIFSIQGKQLLTNYIKSYLSLQKGGMKNSTNTIITIDLLNKIRNIKEEKERIKQLLTILNNNMKDNYKIDYNTYKELSKKDNKVIMNEQCNNDDDKDIILTHDNCNRNENKLLCLYHKGQCISNIIIEYDDDEDTIILTISLYTYLNSRKKKFNSFLCALIIIISYIEYRDYENIIIRCEAFNFVSAYILIKTYLTVPNNEDEDENTKNLLEKLVKTDILTKQKEFYNFKQNKQKLFEQLQIYSSGENGYNVEIDVLVNIENIMRSVELINTNKFL